MSLERPPSNQLVPLSELPCRGTTRRQFCTLAGAGLLALGVPACEADGPRIGTGPLDDPPPAPTVDTAGGTTGGTTGGATGGTTGGTTGGAPDMARAVSTGGAPRDMATGGGTCAGPVNAGPASAIALNTAKRVTDNNHYDIWLCRDSGGLFAMNNYCTHAGCPVDLQPDNTFYCRCHGAQFDFDGTHQTSPARRPMQHYALCIDASGSVLINYNSIVGATTRA